MNESQYAVTLIVTLFISLLALANPHFEAVAYNETKVVSSGLVPFDVQIGYSHRTIQSWKCLDGSVSGEFWLSPLIFKGDDCPDHYANDGFWYKPRDVCDWIVYYKVESGACQIVIQKETYRLRWF